MAVVLGILFALGAATAGADEGPTVNCHDTARDTVSRTLPATCEGAIVSDEEAEAIRARRAAAIRRAMEPRKTFAYPKRRVAGLGSGFFVRRDGILVTNEHVVRRCLKSVSIATTEGDEVQARVLAIDRRNDLAVLKAAIQPPGVATFRPPGEPDDGTPVFVIGYPTKTLPPITPQLTSGTFLRHGDALVSKLELPQAYRKMKAFIYPGNSGGPALDALGRVAGVVVAQVNSVSVYEKTGETVRDLGFYIDNKALFRLLDHIKITFTIRDGGTAAEGKAVFAAAKPFIARIKCWQ
ncbi:MAG: trypsin-like peptidase domain-containing protein [Rhodobacterales bacterium]|nr:trypsin-like peptidase domain-containing protein [Rhodobacterales bacterium]